jgi:hypothetical protein
MARDQKEHVAKPVNTYAPFNQVRTSITNVSYEGSPTDLERIIE